MSRSRRENARRKNRLGYLLLTTSVLASVVVGGFVFTTVYGVEELDEYGCETNLIQDRLVILLDRSDALARIQKVDARRQIESRVADSGIGTRVSLWVLDPQDPDLVTNIFHGCLPPNGRNANALIENERRLRARWRSEFIEPLYNTLDDALSDQPADRSPLMEAIQRIGFEGFGLHRDDGAERRLIILSDLIQHTESYSHYRDGSDYDSFRTKPYALTVTAPLEGVDVEVLYVGRSGQEHIQTNRHGVFWEQHFSNNGALLRSLNRLAGG